MSSSFATTLFCDDVKYEETGKRLYIGVYEDEMVTFEFPLRREKLCVLLTYLTPIENPKLITKVKIKVPGQEPRVMNLNERNKNFRRIPKEAPKGTKYFVSKSVLTIAPFEMLSEGRIVVEVTNESGEEIHAGSLGVKENSSSLGFSLKDKIRSVALLLQVYRESEKGLKRKKGAMAKKIIKTLDRILGNPEILVEGNSLLSFPDKDNSLEFYFVPPLENKPKMKVQDAKSKKTILVKEVSEFGFKIKSSKGLPLPEALKIDIEEQNPEKS